MTATSVRLSPAATAVGTRSAPPNIHPERPTIVRPVSHPRKSITERQRLMGDRGCFHRHQHSPWPTTQSHRSHKSLHDARNAGLCLSVGDELDMGQHSPCRRRQVKCRGKAVKRPTEGSNSLPSQLHAGRSASMPQHAPASQRPSSHAVAAFNALRRCPLDRAAAAAAAAAQ